jgi:predicted  nucleic acid-binding Zn-ribbon protein
MEERSQVGFLLELHKLQNNSGHIDNNEACRGIEENLEPSLLRRYRKLKERKGSGVAILEDCTCSECMIIYPTTHEFLRAKDSVHICEFCSRLLVVKPAGI